jgi:hypothetical protein
LHNLRIKTRKSQEISTKLKKKHLKKNFKYKTNIENVVTSMKNLDAMKQIETTQLKHLCQQKLGIAPEHTTLFILTPHEWDNFSKTQRLKPGSVGWYSPSDLTAYVKHDTKEILDHVVLHEYIGHGLFFEHHPIGQMLHFLNVDSKQNYVSNTVYTLSTFRKHFENKIEEIADEYVSELSTYGSASSKKGDLR